MEGVEDYARARWNDLVRTLLSLGLELDEAEPVAREALERCWSSWPEEHRSGDVDVLVYGELLALCALRRRDNTPTSPDHVAGVLVGGAALERHQVEALVGVSAATPPWGIERWDDLYAGIAPVAAIHEAVRRTRRRRLVVVAGVVAAALAIGGGLLIGADQDSRPTPEPQRPMSRNAIPLAWWGDDVLHLGAVEVETPGLRVLAQAGMDPTYSVVYGDSDGQVVQVDADGSSRRVGTIAPDSPVLADQDGHVVWIDLTADDPSLVLWDPAAGEAIASLDLAGTSAGTDAELLSARDGVVYLAGLRGPEVWRAGESDTQPADAAAAITDATARQSLSPSGRLLVEWGREGATLTVQDPEDPSVQAQTLEAPGTRVVSARFVDDDQLIVISTRTYLLGRDYDDGITQSGRFPVADLVTCDVTTGDCEISRRRAQDVDPSAEGSTIILPS